jgi:hypothetical protein
MPGISWRSCQAPVTIDAAHTGVTDGNAATQSGTYSPRSISAASVGAAPAATARSSIAGAIASITHRTSLGGTVISDAGSRQRSRVLSPFFAIHIGNYNM